MQRHVELRKLPAAALCNVVNILDIDNDWRKLMAVIPKHPKTSPFVAKYKTEHIGLIEKHAEDTKRKCAEVLFDEWGTSGPKPDRPTLEILLDLLVENNMFRAADEITSMLGEPAVTRPKTGPAADITTNLTALLNEESIEQKLHDIASVKSEDFDNSSGQQGNKSTRQLKEPSDLIMFSKDSIKSDNLNDYMPQNANDKNPFRQMIETKFTNNISYTSGDLPNISALQSNKALNNIPTIEVTNSQNSSQQFLPAFSQLIKQGNQSDYPGSSLNITAGNTTSSDSTTDETSSSSIASMRNLHRQYDVPDTYQTSVPNLQIFELINDDILQDKKLLHFDYNELEALTNRFSDNLINTPNGPLGKIGSGGFGDVYAGTHSAYGKLAVKRVRAAFQLSSELSTIMKVFNTEVKSLSHLRHENIVPILGYSIDGLAPCIVCEYIDGGSLQQKIAAKVLTKQERMNIMKGTAEGLRYIHHSERPLQMDDTESQNISQTSKKSYYLHGDVKSANILITKDCVPKLCDFGLAKQLDTTFIMTSMIGTQAYLAPEGFSGTVTQKNDIFSFGIVLLELLTGLKPIVTANGENMNIKYYVEENISTTQGDITPLVDRVVGEWTSAQAVYNLANHCLAFEKNKRPSISGVCEVLKEIYS